MHDTAHGSRYAVVKAALNEGRAAWRIFILPRGDADALFATEKHRIDEHCHIFPTSGQGITIPLVSLDGREDFLLDIFRGKIDLGKARYQNRARSVVVLARLCLKGPHTNPDGGRVSAPHLHLYREGYVDKWATLLPGAFPNPADLMLTLQEFMRFCNITRPPAIQASFLS